MDFFFICSRYDLWWRYNLVLTIFLLSSWRVVNILSAYLWVAIMFNSKLKTCVQYTRSEKVYQIDLFVLFFWLFHDNHIHRLWLGNCTGNLCLLTHFHIFLLFNFSCNDIFLVCQTRWYFGIYPFSHTCLFALRVLFLFGCENRSENRIKKVSACFTYICTLSEAKSVNLLLADTNYTTCDEIDAFYGP